MHIVDVSLLVFVAGLAVIFRRGLRADGYGLDRAYAAAFLGAKAGETMSTLYARGAAAGRRWPCFVCRLLGVLVERGHCAKALVDDGVETPVAASYRAGALLLALTLAFVAVPWAVGRFG